MTETIDLREPQESGLVAVGVIVLVTAAMLTLAWWPHAQARDEWQGPEMPPCAADYLVVC